MFIILIPGALLGWFLFTKIKFPTPQFMGPLVIVSCLSFFNVPLPAMNPHFNELAQIIMGYYLGSSITPQYIRHLKSFIVPVILTVFWSMLITIGFGGILFYLLPFDFATGILSASPGGFPEVGIIALAIQADVPTITLIHIVRMFVVMSLIPLAIRIFGLGSRTISSTGKDLTGINTLEHLELLSFKEKLAIRGRQMRNRFTEIIAWFGHGIPWIAALSGWVFSILHFPAGYLFGSMFAVVFASLCGLKVKPLPADIMGTAFFIVGIYIGVQFSRDAFSKLSGIIIPVIFINILILLSCTLLAYLMQRVTGWKFLVCLLATAPAALFLMVALAADTDSDPFKVSLLHIARLFVVKATLPIIALLLR